MGLVRGCGRGFVLAVALLALQCAAAGGAAASGGPSNNVPPAISEYVEMQPTAGGPKALKSRPTLSEPATASSSAPTGTKSSSAPAGKTKKEHSGKKAVAGGSGGNSTPPQRPEHRLAEPASRSALGAAVGGRGGVGAYLIAAALGSVLLVLLLRVGLRRRS